VSNQPGDPSPLGSGEPGDLSAILPTGTLGSDPEPAFRAAPPDYRARHEAPAGVVPSNVPRAVPVRSALAHLLRTASASLDARALAEQEDLAPVDGDERDPAVADAGPPGPTGSSGTDTADTTTSEPTDAPAAPVAGPSGSERHLAVRITSATGASPLVVHDDGLGLTAAQVRRLVFDTEADLESSPTGLSVDDLVQLEGVTAMVRACLRVAETVELRSRSALEADAPTMRAVINRAGSSRISTAGEPLEAPGTEVRLHLDAEHRDFVLAGGACEIVSDLAQQLSVPVEVDGTPLALPGPLWNLLPAERDAWCADLIGAVPIAVLPLGLGPHGTRAVAVVPPTPMPATRAGGHRIHVDDVLVPDRRARLVPPWAAFCTVVLDAGLLPLTSEGDGLAYGAALDAVGEHVARGLLVQLVLLADLEPERFAAMAEVHHEALLAAAIEHPDVMDLVRGVVTLPTTLGPRTLDDLCRADGPVPYAGVDTWSAVSGVAARDGVLVVDARLGVVARFLESLGEGGPTVAALRPEDLAGFGVALHAA
jgi:hypothetical protein